MTLFCAAKRADFLNKIYEPLGSNKRLGGSHLNSRRPPVFSNRARDMARKFVGGEPLNIAFFQFTVKQFALSDQKICCHITICTKHVASDDVNGGYAAIRISAAQSPDQSFIFF